MRFKNWIRLMVAAAAGLAAVSAHAKPIPHGGLTFQETINWLQAEGFQAKADHLPGGEPVIATMVEGTFVAVVLDDCEKDRCTALEFTARIDKPHAAWDRPSALAKVNDWNHNHPWGRASIDDKDYPFIDMEVSLSPGGSMEALDDMFAGYRDVLADFAKFVAAP